MNIFEDVESIAETVTHTATPGASAATLLDWIIEGLQKALNSPNQHEQLQTAVNTLKANKEDLAAAVEATPAAQSKPSSGAKSGAQSGL